MQVYAKAPTRIDLAGGTLDLWPLYCLLKNPTTINVAISLNAEVWVEPIDEPGKIILESLDQKQISNLYANSPSTDKKLGLLKEIALALVSSSNEYGFHVKTKAQSPAGAGLGGSSCLAVASAAALSCFQELRFGHRSLAGRSLVAFVQDLEAKIIRAPTGCQDYWAALRGGLNVLSYPPGEPFVETLTSQIAQDLNEVLIVCYSGQSRASALNNWEIFHRVFDGDDGILSQLQDIADVSYACHKALNNSNLEELLKCSQMEWQLRRQVWDGVETDKTQHLDQAARRVGALFSRVCGAGGGGVMAVFAAPEDHPKIKRELTAQGGRILDAHVSEQGLKVVKS